MLHYNPESHWQLSDQHFFIGDTQCNNQLVHCEYVSLAVPVFQRIEEAVTSILGVSNNEEYKVDSFKVIHFF